jgi:hypothetical protein
MNELYALTQPSRRMPAVGQPRYSFMVYVLRGTEGGYYIGCTKNLPNRLAAHRAGLVRGSAKLGVPTSLEYVHAWEVPDAFSGDLLETFAWRFHREFGVASLIEMNPHWSSELRAAASEITPTDYEKRHKYCALVRQARTVAC